jgi:predicted ATPase
VVNLQKIKHKHKMSKISFKNFRGFIDFPEMDFGGITFLVGKNNSGKSTAIKAYEFISDYLKSSHLARIYFVSIKDLKSLKKILNSKATNDSIQINMDNNSNKVMLNITEINSREHNPSVEFVYESKEYNYKIILCTKTGDGLPYEVRFCCDDVMGIPILEIAENNLCYLKLWEILKEKFDEVVNIYQHRIDNFYYSNSESDTQPNIIKIRNIENLTQLELEKDLLKYVTIGNDIYNRLLISPEFDIEFYSIEMIQIKRNSLFNANDEEDLLANIFSFFYINDLYDKKIITSVFDVSTLKNVETITFREFVIKWLSKDGFGIGDDFKVEKVYDNYYSLMIKENEEWRCISEMGLGVIRIVNNIFILMYTLYFARESTKSVFTFEEPELNLHPALQSKLADLFYEVHALSKGKIQIIVETHSEYIIRRTQVLVAEKKLETKPNKNPFKIYYFNDDGDKSHYRIEYDEDGILKRNFGNGFFDEASSNTLKLLRLKKAKLN